MRCGPGVLQVERQHQIAVESTERPPFIGTKRGDFVMIPDSPALKRHLSNHPCSRIYFFRVRVSWIFLRRCNKKITKRRICKKTSEIWNPERTWGNFSSLVPHATEIKPFPCETLSDFLLNAGWKKGNLCVLVHQYMHLEISDSCVTYKAKCNMTWCTVLTNFHHN